MLLRGSEAEQGNAGGQKGANRGNGGGACGRGNIGAVSFAVAEQVDLIDLPSEAGSEAVALLEHLVISGEKRLLGGSVGGGARGLVGHDVGRTSLDLRVSFAVRLGAESGRKYFFSRLECGLGVAQEPVALGATWERSVNLGEAIEGGVACDLAGVQEVRIFGGICAVSTVGVAPAGS